jgi:hypothetical protein
VHIPPARLLRLFGGAVRGRSRLTAQDLGTQNRLREYLVKYPLVCRYHWPTAHQRAASPRLDVRIEYGRGKAIADHARV